MIPTVTLLATGLAVLLQTRVWSLLRPSALVGDEAAYARTEGAQRIAGRLFVRVPGQYLIVQAARAMAGDTAPRFAMMAVAVGAVLLTVLALEMSGNRAGAVLAGILLVLSLERAVLGLHLWPDGIMGLLWLTGALCLTGGDSDGPYWAALAGAFAMLIRIEGAGLWALAVILAAFGASPGLAVWCVLPGLAVLVFATVWNGVAHGVWRPDSTLSFNLAVARTELAAPTQSVGEAIRRTIAARTASLRGLTLTILGRLKLLFGPESFLSQRLLAGNTPGYARADWLTRPGPARWILRHGFSVASIPALAALPVMPPVLVVLYALMVALYSGVLTRSRFRMAMLPVSAFMAGLALPLWATADVQTLMTCAALPLGLLILLIFGPDRVEEIAP